MKMQKGEHIIELSGMGISEIGAGEIANSLSSSEVTELHLENNELGTQGASIIANALEKSKLTYLSLMNNVIGDPGALAIAKNLPKSKLTTLDLRRNRFMSTQTCSSLCGAFKKSILTNMNLIGNPCFDDEEFRKNITTTEVKTKEVKLKNRYGQVIVHDLTGGGYDGIIVNNDLL